MKKSYIVILILLIMVVDIMSIIFVKNHDLSYKLSLVYILMIGFLISFLSGIIKGKNGLVIGITVGITISFISLILHFVFARDMFDLLYLRLLIIISSSAFGGVLGVNKKTIY